MHTSITRIALWPLALALAACHPGASDEHAPARAATAAADAVVNRSIDQLLGDHAKYEPVIRAFRKAVIAQDAAGVAALVAYPIKVRIDGKTATIGTSQDFIAHYDRIVTPPMAAAIGGQRYGELFVNQQGVMFGSGEAWINGLCKDTACKQVEIKVVALQPGAQP